jgi:Ran GTPase-activating protein (RanGAP) involved in mRNA processing and transport
VIPLEKYSKNGRKSVMEETYDEEPEQDDEYDEEEINRYKGRD